MSEDRNAADDNSQSLEVKMMNLLKRLKDIRIAHSPLILLTREDLSQELQSLAHKAQDVSRKQQEWVNSLPMSLADLCGYQHPPLAATYKCSPMNSSHPYSLPRELRALRNDTCDKSDALRADIVRLQRDADSMMTGRVKRKLESFSVKWGTRSDQK
ncbi:hypothetical protein SERLA73DRAFT_178692 [Serpula lacrymans var. lacrymans S7.3]|uniref:Uncharacterized protein n=1 Tax=Serpula lacrymans var. lacrymans (strain S7.3) TaxID=936435 RepID=F8PSK7_SERL3|nr:hypothetical protein SERLA73DRAFT_178692 [Serpula lacrymans var. lacrymans S7.3]